MKTKDITKFPDTHFGYYVKNKDGMVRWANHTWVKNDDVFLLMNYIAQNGVKKGLIKEYKHTEAKEESIVPTVEDPAPTKEVPKEDVLPKNSSHTPLSKTKKKTVKSATKKKTKKKS